MRLNAWGRHADVGSEVLERNLLDESWLLFEEIEVTLGGGSQEKGVLSA